MAHDYTVSTRLEQLISQQFGTLTPQVIQWLERLNLPLVTSLGKPGVERVQTAIIIIAAGNMNRFLDAIQLAELDWRDVLVAAGLANGDWATRLDDILG